MTNLWQIYPFGAFKNFYVKINKIDLIDRHLVKDGLNTKIYNVKFSSNELQFSTTVGMVDKIINKIEN